MAPSTGTVTQYTSITASQSSDAIVHVVSNCADTLIVCVTITRAAVGVPSTVSSITSSVGTPTFTFIRSAGADDNLRNEMWYSTNASAGSQTLTVNYDNTNNDARSVVAIDGIDIDQTTPVGADTATTSTGGTTYSNDFPTDDPESLKIVLASKLGSDTITPDIETTELSDQNAGTDHNQWIASRIAYGASGSNTNERLWRIRGVGSNGNKRAFVGVEFRSIDGTVREPKSIDVSIKGRSSDATIDVTFSPSVLQENDLFVISIANTKSATSPSEQVTQPGGWTTLYDENITATDAVRASVFYRFVPSGGLTSPINFTLPTAQPWEYLYHVFRGVDLLNPIDVSSTFNTGTSTTPTSPTATTLTDFTKNLRIMWTENAVWTNDVVSSPSGHDHMGATEVFSPGGTLAIAQEYQKEPAATGTAQWSIDSSQPWGAVTFALRSPQYVSEEIIYAEQLNRFLEDVKSIYGVGFGDKGYGQTQYTLNYVATVDLINSSNWTNMRNALIICRDYQEATASYTGTIPPTTVLQIGDEIQAHESSAPTSDVYDFNSEIFSSVTDRLNSAGGSFSGFVTNTVTRATAWGSGASETIDCTVDLTFTSEDAARYFFNSSATLRIIMDHPDTTVGHNAAWNTTLGTIVGTVSMNTTATSSTGTASGTADTAIGFYDLTDSLQTVYNGANIGPAGYTTNDVIIQARRLNFVGCNGGNGDGVRFVISLTDQDTDAVDSVASGTNAQFSAFRTTTLLVNPGIETPGFNVVDGF